jgi:hypothetical protein
MLEGGEGIGCLDTGDNTLSVTVGKALRKTLTREMEALEDHLGDGGTLQVGRVRLDGVSVGSPETRNRSRKTRHEEVMRPSLGFVVVQTTLYARQQHNNSRARFWEVIWMMLRDVQGTYGYSQGAAMLQVHLTTTAKRTRFEGVEECSVGRIMEAVQASNAPVRCDSRWSCSMSEG